MPNEVEKGLMQKIKEINPCEHNYSKHRFNGRAGSGDRLGISVLQIAARDS